MKKLSLFAAAIAFAGSLSAQSYSSPESIEYDYVSNRWLISNNGDGKILSRNSATGAISVFASGIASGPHGLEIVNDTVYACDGAFLRAYNRVSGGAAIFSVNLGATFLNGITNDGNNLYITDFSAKKIYRYTIATRQFNVFVTGLAKSPNGIVYDASNNRCVFVNWGSAAPIMAVSTVDSTVSTLTTTTLSNCDGITRDFAGNYFVSSWGINGISRFNNTFTGGPTTVITGLSNPADIFYNVLTDTLGVPNSGSTGINGNKATFHFLGSTVGIGEKGQGATAIYPNPASADLTIVLEPASRVVISDAAGRVVYSGQSQGSSMIVDVRAYPAGTYFVRINEDAVKKFTVVK